MAKRSAFARVLYVTDVSGAGGSRRHKFAVKTLLPSAGWSVEQVSGVSPLLRLVRRFVGASGGARPSGGGGALADVMALVIPVLAILNSVERTIVLVARMLIRRPDVVLWRPDVFQFHGQLAAKLLGVPLVLELNAPLATEGARFRGYGLADLASKIERRVVGSAVRIITVSEEVAQPLWPDGRVVVVPNGGGFVDADEVAAARTWGHESCPLCTAPEARRYAVILETFRPWHGEVERRQAVDSLPDGWTALVIGDGPARASFLDWAERKAPGKVRALGSLPAPAVQHILRHHASLGLVLYPPDDGFYFSPLKLYDFLAHGLPVVATDIGQVGRVARSTRATIRLVQAGDEAAISDGIEDACSWVAAQGSSEVRRGELVDPTFGWGSTVDAYAAVMVEALAPRVLELRRAA